MNFWKLYTVSQNFFLSCISRLKGNTITKMLTFGNSVFSEGAFSYFGKAKKDIIFISLECKSVLGGSNFPNSPWCLRKTNKIYKFRMTFSFDRRFWIWWSDSHGHLVQKLSLNSSWRHFGLSYSITDKFYLYIGYILHRYLYNEIITITPN